MASCMAPRDVVLVAPVAYWMYKSKVDPEVRPTACSGAAHKNCAWASIHSPDHPCGSAYWMSHESRVSPEVVP
jgi:hypothetical protein